MILEALGAALVLATLWSALQFEGLPPEWDDETTAAPASGARIVSSITFAHQVPQSGN